jgi:hypothetical protein
VLGYYAFRWLGEHGFYALVLPGTMIGLGFGVCSGIRSPWGAVLCGIAGVAFGLFIECHWFPFRADQSLGYFLAHLLDLPLFTLLLVLLGGVFSAWLGLGRGRWPVDADRAAPPSRFDERAGSTTPEDQE